MKRATTTTTTAKPSRQVKVLDVFCMADHQQFKGTSRSLLITTIQPYRRYRHRCVVCRVRSVFEYFDASQIVLVLLVGVCCGFLPVAAGLHVAIFILIFESSKKVKSAK